MARFPRPQGSIENAADLKVGDVIYHVYGIWPPVASDMPHTITRAAILLRDHPEGGPDDFQRDLLVYDESWGGLQHSHMAFASDGNMVPGKSHNDNYCFRTKEAAEAARDYLRAQWQAHPELIAKEVEQRELDRLCDDFDGDDWQDYAADENASEENAL